MSLSGNLAVGGAKLGEDKIHYDNEPTGPGASTENPGGVFPGASPVPAGKSHQDRLPMPMVNEGGGPTAGTAVAEPKAAGGIPGTGNPEDSENDPRVVFSNPAMFSEQMIKLSHSLTEVIQAIEDESGSGIGGVGRSLIHKFETWRNEVDMLRAGKPVESSVGQGDVHKKGEGGLYSD